MPKIFAGALAALILALLSSAPQPAAAATVNFGTLSTGDVPVLGAPPYFGSGNDQLLDTFLFKVSTPANVAAIGGALNFAKFKFTNLTAELIQGTDITCTLCNVLATATVGAAPLGPTFDLVFAGLAPATQYFLRVIGSFGTSGTGSYSGLLTISAVPIPPALLLFGTAIAGAAAFARRRAAKRDAKA